MKCMRICDVLNENQLRNIKKIARLFTMDEEWVFVTCVNIGITRLIRDD